LALASKNHIPFVKLSIHPLSCPCSCVNLAVSCQFRTTIPIINSSRVMFILTVTRRYGSRSRKCQAATACHLALLSHTLHVALPHSTGISCILIYENDTAKISADRSTGERVYRCAFGPFLSFNCHVCQPFSSASSIPPRVVFCIFCKYNLRGDCMKWENVHLAGSSDHGPQGMSA
jgi:hypothetical protein